MAERTDRAPRVTALFDELESARDAIGRLELRGVDGTRIDLAGPVADAAQRAPRQQDRDERTVRRTIRGSAVGIVVGLVGGAIIGLLIGLAIEGAFTVTAVAVTFALAALGAVLGLILPGVSRLKQTPAWEDTFEAPAAGPVTVVVTPEDDEQHALVVEVLEGTSGVLEHPHDA